MTTPKLWRLSGRASPYASLAEQFTRDRDGGSADDEVSVDLYFADETPNAVGAFSISGSSTLTFSSEALVGPPPGLLPTAWFKLDTRRVVLAEMEYIDQSGSGLAATPVTKTLYLANWPYFDDENSRVYPDCINSVPRYNRSIDRGTLRGRWTSSIGTVEIDNADGAFDGMLAYACDGSEIRFYIGDAGDVMRGIAPWKRSEFIFAFSARVAKIVAPAWDRISIVLKDAGALLTQKIGGSVVVGGSGPQAQQPRPWNFGYVRQGEAILKDAATLTYVHDVDGVNCTLLAVRDKGYPVGFTDNGDGTFSLLAPPAGVVTYDLLKTRGTAGTNIANYPNSAGSYRVSDAFYQIAGVECGLVAAGAYAGPLAIFRPNGISDYYVGLHEPQARDGVAVLNDLCESANAFYCARRDGQFAFGVLRPDAADFLTDVSVEYAVGDDDLLGSIRIDHAAPGDYDVQGIANVNWTQQTEFAGGLTATQLANLQRDGYRTTTYGTRTAGQDAYLGPDLRPDGWGDWFGGAPDLYHKTMTRAANIRTLISSPVDDPDATTALGDWQAFRRAQPLPWLEFIDLTVDLSYFQAEIGDRVTLELSRFGLAGLTYQIVTVDIGLTEGTIALGVARRRPAVNQHWTL